MKKTLLTILCLLMVVFMLVGCGERVIGAYLPNYDYEPEEIEELTFNVYIICGEETTENAQNTVEQRLTQYTEEKFYTTLNIFYIKETEDYAAKIKEVTAADAQNKADIILINSEELANYLIENNRLADLTDLYETNAFGKLNVQITSTLLEASKVPTWVTVTDENGAAKKDADGKEVKELQDRLFTVPNNRVLGQYEYVLINKQVARHYYYGDDDLATLTNEAAIAEFKSLGDDAEAAVTYVTGDYADKALYEAQGYYVNIMKYPTVTSADAFESAFAVVNGTADVTRAMEIIYAINTDETIYNTLLYGVKGTNYTVDDNENVVRVSEGNSVYYMNLIHTGDVFQSYYCDEFDWDWQAAVDGKNQNAESVIEESAE